MPGRTESAAGRGVLAQKSVIITGAGRGLGRAYAVHAASEGAAVVVNDIDGAAAEEVVARIHSDGGMAIVSTHSVSDWNAARDLVASCLTAFGRLDGVVNNAGVISICEPADEDESSIRSTVEVNLVGSAFVGTHAMRVMTAQRSGSIVNATSSAQLGIHQLGIYGATKGALASLTYGWAIDLAKHNVRVNAYSPVASTDMTSRSPIPVTGVPTPEDNAAVVTYLLSDLASDVTGQVVQRRGTTLTVMQHPDYSDHVVDSATWTTEDVVRLLGPVLRSGRQPVGDPRIRDSVPSLSS